MPQRHCLNCGALTRTTRCPPCQTQWEATRRPSSTQRGYNADYRKRRAALIGQPCHWCGEPADTAEHLTPLSIDERSNDLVPACHRCNYSRGNRPTPPRLNN